jgi:hypothetical protein
VIPVLETGKKERTALGVFSFVLFSLLASKY